MMCVFTSSGLWSCLSSVQQDACLLTACSEGVRQCVYTQVQDCDPVSALYNKMHVFWPLAQKEWDNVCIHKFRIVILSQLCTARCMSSDRLLRKKEMTCKQVQDCDPLSPPFIGIAYLLALLPWRDPMLSAQVQCYNQSWPRNSCRCWSKKYFKNE